MMIAKHPKILLILVAAASFTACEHVKTGPAPKAMDESALPMLQQTWPDLTAESLEAGRKIFVARCSKCHGYPDVIQYDKAKWPYIVDEMGHKAKLGDEDIKTLASFILAWQAVQAQNAPSP